MSGRKYVASEFDIHLGREIAMQRRMRGLSQKDVAAHLGVTFQQIQKYETGSNRLAVRTLYKIAEYFEISVDKLVTGATSKFNDDQYVSKTMDLMYTKMNASQRRLMLRMAMYVSGVVSE